MYGYNKMYDTKNIYARRCSMSICRQPKAGGRITSKVDESMSVRQRTWVLVRPRLDLTDAENTGDLQVLALLHQESSCGSCRTEECSARLAAGEIEYRIFA